MLSQETMSRGFSQHSQMMDCAIVKINLNEISINSTSPRRSADFVFCFLIYTHVHENKHYNWLII